MKKIYSIISIIALAAIAVSCSKEIDNPELNENAPEVTASEVIPGESITVTLSVPDSPDTKTALGTKEGSSYPVYWSDGDGAYLSLNGTAAYESTKNSTTQYTAKFKPASGLSVYNFLYRGVSGRDDQVVFPASQSFVSGGFDPASMPMYAASASRSNSVTFNHLGALLKFSLTCNDTDHLPANKGIDAVTLTAEDENISLSGTFTIGKTSNLLNGTLTPASGGASLTYSFGTHKSLSSTPFVFYVAIPAGTYEGGIKLTIVDNNGGSMDLYVMTEAAKKTIAAGTVREFETVEYVPASEANLIMIYDDASFLKFVNAVAAGRKTVNARVTKNTSPLTLLPATVSAFTSSIQGYKGIFDGNNKEIAGLDKPLFDDLQGTVKNLTLNSNISVTDASDYQLGIFAKTIVPSSEVDDDPGLQNCTANGSVTFTPSAVLSSQPSIGGLVGFNKGGVISNCTNNATVTFGDDAGVTHTGDRQPAIGGVVARTKGGAVISNSTNAGTVSCAEQFGGTIYIGGTIGFSEATADVISGCTNSGLVKALASGSTDKALHIGGVLGLGKCTIESCTNLAAGTVTTEACSVGTYLCQGGVIGRMNATSGTYSGLSNAGNINVAAAGASSGAYIGGIVGRCNEGAAVSDCTNTGGTIEFTGSISTCPLHIGGIVGNTNKPVSGCTNGTAIIAGGSYSYNSSGNYYSVGGIVGWQSADEPLTNNTNNAAVTFSGTSTGYTAIGGIIGYSNGAISGGGNAGTVTFSGSSNTQNIPIGGVAARTPSGKSGDRISGVTNSGAIVINTGTQTKKTVYVGGVVGHHQSGDFTATNSGTLTVTSLTCTNLILGGLAGQTAGAILSGSANQVSGDISIAGLTSGQDSYIGGAVGKCTSTVTANNAGDVVLTSGSSASRSLFVGGVIGHAGGAISSCTNSGLVSNAAPMNGTSYYMQIGGVVGYNNSSAPLSNCHNTGDITNTADSADYLYIGGITSESDAAISNCDNTGDVTNSGASGNSHPIAVGGIAGKANGAFTSCSNGTSSAAGGTISNSGASAEDVCLGGVAGINEGKTFTTCYNKGAVTNSGTGGSLHIGGLAGWSSASSTYTSACYNNGAISNSGTGSNTTASVRMGGIVGSASGVNTLSGTSVSYNYNSGDITESSESSKPAIGGICGYADNASTDFSYCKNLSDSEIEIKNNSREIVCVGGIIGFANAALTIDYSSNAGAITFTTLDVTSSLRAGGILGAWGDATEQTIKGCTNSGSMTAANTAAESKANATVTQNLTNSTASDTRTYIGGIVGGPNKENKIYNDCHFSGSIRIYCQHCTWLGGIAGYNNVAPVSCTNTGTIRWYKRGGHTSTRSAVGGFYGYCSAASYSGLTYDADINTNNSSPFAYTGGIVGQVARSVDFSDCKIAGRVYGAGTQGTNQCGLFLSMSSGTNTYNFTNCKIKDGTKWHTTALSTSTTLEKKHLIGGANGNGSTGTINTSETISIVESGSF